AIITEPIGGAHRDAGATIASTGDAIADALSSLGNLDRAAVRRHRREKFLEIGRNL
ncbi:MAG TPA: acetyl-CoA carboxylase carboxyl transferase subunit alpha, partial [Xanthobacteraceae bacterium]|nr:acetyl-CoA carboxylase carboxyl transferase subunit alpha [Xanthobacteraceae bacterium]